jgi:hypothetical protein
MFEILWELIINHGKALVGCVVCLILGLIFSLSKIKSPYKEMLETITFLTANIIFIILTIKKLFVENTLLEFSGSFSAYGALGLFLLVYGVILFIFGLPILKNSNYVYEPPIDTEKIPIEEILTIFFATICVAIAILIYFIMGIVWLIG